MTSERESKFADAARCRQGNLAIVLENVFDPHNISAVLRTCDAVGVQDVFIVNTEIPKHRKWGYRSSSGAIKWLTRHEFTDLDDCMQEVKKKYDKVLISYLGDAAVSIYRTNFTESCALVFGNEHVGVSNEMLQYGDANIFIPQMGLIKSLNISVACAITLYEAFRQKNEAGHYNNHQLSAEQQQLLNFWVDRDRYTKD